MNAECRINQEGKYMFSKKMLAGFLLFVLCTGYSLFSTSLYKYDCAMIKENGYQTVVSGKKLQEFKQFLSQRMYTYDGYPACGFDDNHSICFIKDGERLTFCLAPCSCGMILIKETNRYIELLPSELKELKAYIRDVMKEGE